MVILINTAAIFAALVILAWVKDINDEEEDKKNDEHPDNSWTHGGSNE